MLLRQLSPDVLGIRAKTISRRFTFQLHPAWELARQQGEVVEQIIRPTGLLDPVIEVVPARNQVVHLLGEISKTVLKLETEFSLLR